MKKVWIIIGAVLVVVVVLALGVVIVMAQSRMAGDYQSRVQTDWAKLNDSLAQLDSAIAAKESFSFTDTAKDADALRRTFDERAIYYRSMTPPAGGKLFHAYYVDYLSKASAALSAIGTNCSTWSESETAKMRSADTALCDSSRYCATAWNGKRALVYKPDLFQNVPSIFNQMHQARKPAPPVSTVVVERNNDSGGSVMLSSDYVLPDSSSRDLSSSEILGLTPWQLRIARNEIYARHGLRFQTAAMSQYFGSKCWYHPRYNSVDGELSPLEKRNIQRIRGYER
ncbi:MAG: YARHG domain-containing protein [Candidatus Berkelbacteria bacterium]|nr:YARHG domain-containing protein [Candidatus Berkelbacteria bacterium]